MAYITKYGNYIWQIVITNQDIRVLCDECLTEYKLEPGDRIDLEYRVFSLDELAKYHDKIITECPNCKHRQQVPLVKGTVMHPERMIVNFEVIDDYFVTGRGHIILVKTLAPVELGYTIIVDDLKFVINGIEKASSQPHVYGLLVKEV